MTPLQVYLGVGLVTACGLGLVLFALWLEAFTRGYGEAGGPPWERHGPS